MAKLTPQELIDLPGYGAAERQLRKDGRWLLTPEEKMDMAIDAIRAAETAAIEAQEAK